MPAANNWIDGPLWGFLVVLALSLGGYLLGKRVLKYLAHGRQSHERERLRREFWGWE